MKVFFHLVFSLFICLPGQGSNINSSESNTPFPTVEKIIIARMFLNMKIKDLEKLADRKFTFKEKIKIRLLKFALKKNERYTFYKFADPDKQATLSFIFALAAIGLLIPGLLNTFSGVLFLIIIPLLAIGAVWFGYQSRKSGKNFKNTFGFIVGASIIILGIIIGANAFSL